MKNRNKYATAGDCKSESRAWKFLKLFARPLYDQFAYVLLFLCFIDFWTLYVLVKNCFTSAEKISSIISVPELIVNTAILFLFAYFGALVMTVTRNRWLRRLVKIFLYGLVLTLFLLRFFLRHNFNLDINLDFLILLLGAHRTEIMEFVNQYVFSSRTLLLLLIITIYAISIIALESFWKRKKRCVKKIPLYVKRTIYVVVLFLFVTGLCSTNVYYKVYKAKTSDDIKALTIPKDPISSTIISFVRLHKTNKTVRDAIELNKGVYETENAYTINDDSVNVVVVIGESFIKWHSPLYGYNLNTTPNMYREMLEGRLFVFNDVISSSNGTSIVMKNMLCCNNTIAKEKWYDYPSFLTIFKKAGYNVYYWDNQCLSSVLSNYSYVLNNFIYNPELEQIFYTQTNSKPYAYDADLVNDFNAVCNLSEQKNLILFHLLGQHVAPSKRFPSDSFRYFTSKDIKRKDDFLTEKMKEYIADYDNATLYNDNVMNMIFDKFKDTNTILLYFSDHGDEAYDFRAHCGRYHGELTPMVLKYQYDIPFVVWCSDTYKKNNPDVVNSICQAVDRPFVLDNVCNMLFNIGGISTSYYRENLDLISPNYQCQERLVKGEIYEEIRYDY